MRAQQAVPFCCRFANNRHFPLKALSQCRNCGDTIDAKTHVGVSWSVATREFARHVDEITLVVQMSIYVALFRSFCEPVQPRLPQSRERFRLTFLHWSLFCSCWNSSPDTEVRWCPKKLWLLLLCVKLHMKFERTRLLKDGKRRFETEWHATSAESCSCRNLKMRPDQKTTAAIYDSKHTWFFLTYMNDVYSCSFKKYYTPIWFKSYPTALLYVLQFHATLLTKNLLNQKSASTPWTHFSKIRGVLLWRGVTIEMNLLKFMKVLFLKVLPLHRRLGDVVYNARNVCELQFVTGHIALDEKLVT